jgi:hypothetical protein
VRFPGGVAAWSNVSGVSVKLLAKHYDTRRSIFPYFEKLPGLGRAEFEALAAFEEVVSGQPRDRQNIILGEWHSLVKLIELGSRAGSLNAETAAGAFRRALSSPDYSIQAMAVLRAMTGESSDVDEAMPSHLLRLGTERRMSFERVKQLQRVPRLTSVAGSSQQTVAALPADDRHRHRRIVICDSQS